MNKNKFYMVLIAFTFLLIGINYSSSLSAMENGFKLISPAEALEMIKNDQDLLVIDVSTGWADGHLPGALSYPLFDGSFEEAVPSWDKNKKYLIYCHGDAPAIAASEILVKAGFPHVYRLEGNYSGWVDAGYEIEIHTYTDISAAELNQMIKDNTDLVVIDVSPLYRMGHIPGAINYFVGNGSLDEAIPSLDPAAKYVVYCHSDEASQLGAQKLIDAGFMHVYRLAGNFAAWKEAGYPIE